MRCYYECLGYVPKYVQDHVIDQFMSSNYLWMFPFRKFMRRRVNYYITSLQLAKLFRY